MDMLDLEVFGEDLREVIKRGSKKNVPKLPSKPIINLWDNERDQKVGPRKTAKESKIMVLEVLGRSGNVKKIIFGQNDGFWRFWDRRVRKRSF